MRINLGRVIRISYRGPTNTRGTRWVLSCDAYPRKTYTRSYELDAADDAFQAAVKYARANGIRYRKIAFGSYKGNYYAILTF